MTLPTTPQVSDDQENQGVADLGAHSGVPQNGNGSAPQPSQPATNTPDAFALVMEGLFSLDGRLLRGIKTDRNQLLSAVHRDFARGDDFPVNLATDLLGLAYREAMSMVAYLRARMEKYSSADDGYAEAKALFEQALVQLLQIRAAYGPRNGELGSSGSSTG